MSNKRANDEETIRLQMPHHWLAKEEKAREQGRKWTEVTSYRLEELRQLCRLSVLLSALACLSAILMMLTVAWRLR